MLLLVFVVVVVSLAAPAANASTWRRPVDGTVLRAFDVGSDRFAAGQHRGVDLGAPVGAPVRAACGGRVSFAGRVPGGGLTVSVRCGRLVATYQHLARAAVRSGQVLQRGAVLGGVGRSGTPRGAAPHLHLGAREATSGRYVDPMSLIGAAPRALPPPPPRGPDARPPALVPGAVRAPVPSARPLPLELAPVPQAVRPGAARQPRPVAVPPAPVPGVPATVWAGLGCVALGLPLGGFMTVSRRRRRRELARVARTA